MFSFGFQKAFQRGFQADDEVFFTRVRDFVWSWRVRRDERRPDIFQSLESAKMVVTVLVDTLVPTGYIRYAPDGAWTALCFAPVCRKTSISGYFVFAAFASAFMLKVLSISAWPRLRSDMNSFFFSAVASTPGMLPVHHPGARGRDPSAHWASHRYYWLSPDSDWWTPHTKVVLALPGELAGEA
jgi:hypothetical protein